MEDSFVKVSCGDCGADITIDKDNPPADKDILSCKSCGVAMGSYGDIMSALNKQAKAEVDRIAQETFGMKPTWKKG